MENVQEAKFLGRWKSGRVWKSPEDRASKKIQSRGIGRKSWDQKVAERQLLALEKASNKERQEAKVLQKEILRKRREESRKRKEECLEKAKITQTISNSRKIKRMTRKQRKTLKMNK